MNPNLSNDLRRSADSLLEFLQRISPEITGTPWKIQIMYEAAAEIEQHREAFNETSVLRMAAQYLSTTPERLRELVQADKERTDEC